MSEDIYTGEETCQCTHAHHRHDMGSGCIECRCKGFVESIASLVGIFGSDWTGGLCSVCFVKWRRGYEPDEMPHLECARIARGNR